MSTPPHGAPPAGRIAVFSVAVAAVAYVVAGLAEILAIRVFRPSELELAWISDMLLATALGIAIYLWQHLRATRTALLDRERAELVLTTQLSVAADLQRRLLPVLPAGSAEVEWAAALRSAGQIGGDFYDLVTFPDGRAMLLVADVSGKGIPAAMALSTLRAVFRSLARPSIGPGHLLTQLSAALYDQWTGSPYFTALVAVVDVRAGTLEYANGGHPAAVVTGASGTRLLASLDPPAALLPGLGYHERTVLLEAGDMCAFVSDGVTEAIGDDASDAIEALLGQGEAAPGLAADVCESLMATARRGQGPEGVADWDDDRTVVVLSVIDRAYAEGASPLRTAAGQRPHEQQLRASVGAGDAGGRTGRRDGIRRRCQRRRGRAVRVPGFGTVAVYRPAGPPQQVVLFLSGDGGWNLGSCRWPPPPRRRALVFGIDVRPLLANQSASAGCAYLPAARRRCRERWRRASGCRCPAADPRRLLVRARRSPTRRRRHAARDVCRRAQPRFLSGPPGSAPLCQMRGLRAASAGTASATTWRAQWRFHGAVDRAARGSGPRLLAGCGAGVRGQDRRGAPGRAAEGGTRVRCHGELGATVRAGLSGPGAPRPAAPNVATAPEIADLKLVVPATRPANDTMAVLLTGDGGWADLDKAVAAGLAAHGIPVVGWSSLSYYWSPRTPDGASADLARILRHYGARWQGGRA
ncbi:MAG: SpoIIE family protein phosphatase [Vicinamibacterales bacterium]